MDTVKSPRFILAMTAVIAVVILAVLGKIDGSTAIGTILGLAVGSSVAINNGKKEVK